MVDQKRAGRTCGIGDVQRPYANPLAKATTPTPPNRITHAVQYLACIRDVVKNPDEIWINNERAGTSYNNYTIIKYYQDEILVVCCRLDRDNINQVRTWFPLRMKKETIEKHRRGLLIYTTKAPRNGGALV
ncbi:MAG: PBECR2 nuclease fold domain-containing protein [Alistipes indistinctus]